MRRGTGMKAAILFAVAALMVGGAWADAWFDYHTATWTYCINGDEVEIIE